MVNRGETNRCAVASPNSVAEWSSATPGASLWDGRAGAADLSMLILLALVGWLGRFTLSHSQRSIPSLTAIVRVTIFQNTHENNDIKAKGCHANLRRCKFDQC